MKNNIEELGNLKDLQNYLANSRKIQEVPYLRKNWLEITYSESERRMRKPGPNNINLNGSCLSLTDTELDRKFLEDKYAVLEEAIQN